MPVANGPKKESAHDVLAADEFAMPAPDPALRRDPVSLPDDPTGIAEPHDVLAAEEFAMPAPPPGSFAEHSSSPGRLAAWGAGAVGLALVFRRLKR
ncbi:MAG: hypothetical protein M3076_10040 [Actinomycetota bacterium]|nr:hypothetical protein [Actinomycetota bacterium]